ncbi:MAG: hypothetical protein IKH08_01365 [Prevotella sp.]|nr:hypothetical protein [Prevotella sp.]
MKEASVHRFTEQCRKMQGLYREELGEQEGVGPFPHSKNKHMNMLVNGDVTGKNFLSNDIFEYAKQRVEQNKQRKNETIEAYRLFNNMLSSQPMAFNLFRPLMRLLEEDRADDVTRMVRAAFPLIPVGQVFEVGIEFLHEDIERYLDDKTAMDAIIRYYDSDQVPCFIAIETKYTDVLGENGPRDASRHKELIKQLHCFKPDSETALLSGRIEISQIYRNFLLAESYRLGEPSTHENTIAYSVVLAPKDHPTTASEVASLRDELAEPYSERVMAVPLEQVVRAFIDNAPADLSPLYETFYYRYLDFSRLHYPTI